MRVTLDHAGMRSMLTSIKVRSEITQLGNRVADSVKIDPDILRHGAIVQVDNYETDRAASAVTIKHAGGQGIEAKYGPLARSARFFGLQVKSKK